MQAEKTRDRIPMTQEERDAIFAEIMKNLGDDEQEPTEPRRTWLPSWSDMVTPALVLGVIASYTLMVLPWIVGSRSHFIAYFGTASASAFAAILGWKFARWQAARRPR
jgi:hypothetical protein